MISFKNREEIAPSVLILLSLLILLGSLAVMLFVPKPSTAGLARGKEMSRKKLESEIAQAKERTKEATAAAKARLWQGTPDAVTASVLAQLTGEANRRRLQIGAFRPQKPNAVAGLTELPFSVLISGPYPAIRAFAATLDGAGSKTALRSLQIAGADGASSQVTATLGISAYIPASLTLPATPTAPATSAPTSEGKNNG